MRRGKSLAQCLVCALTVVTLAAAAPAQDESLSVAENVLSPGGSATVTYTDPSSAGETVLIVVDNGGVDTEWDYVLINLDANGQGTGTWSVPESGWFMAVFTAPDGSSTTRAIASTERLSGGDGD